MQSIGALIADMPMPDSAQVLANKIADALFAAKKAGAANGQPLMRAGVVCIIADHLRGEQPATARKRDELIDALLLACGTNPLEATKAALSAAGVAKADIKSVSPDVTPSEFRIRADLYRRRHRDWPLTPSALAKYWGELGPALGQTRAAQDSVAPEKWRDAIPHLYDDPSTAKYMISLGWSALGAGVKEQVKRWLQNESTQEQQ